MGTRDRLATSFEDGEPVPPPGGGEVALAVGPGPDDQPSDAPGRGASGVRCVRARWQAGTHESVLLVADVAIGPDTWFGYTVFIPLAEPPAEVALDLVLDDGTTLSGRGARDEHGTPLTPSDQGRSGILWPRQWNRVECHAGAFAAGRTASAVVVRVGELGRASESVDEPGRPDPLAGGPTGVDRTVDRPSGPERLIDVPNTSDRMVWIDDVEIAPRARGDLDPVDLVDTRRGSRSGHGLSRGNTFPAAAVPNGAALLSPMTAPRLDWFYRWSGDEDARGLPVLHGMVLSHAPSPWMGDRNPLVVRIGGGSSPFRHDDETARPYRYTVRLEDGVVVDAAPTVHGAIIRLTARGGRPAGTLGDGTAGVAGQTPVAGAGPVAGDTPATRATPGGGRLRIALGTVGGACVFRADDPATGEVHGWLESGSRLSVGRSRLYVAARVDVPFSAAQQHDGIGLDLGDARAATIRVATSLIGLAQARAALAGEIGPADVDEIAGRARSAWAERLGVLEIEGASRDELVTAYSCLYRVNLYPTVPTEVVDERSGEGGGLTDDVAAGRPPAYAADASAGGRLAYASPVLPPVAASTDERTGAAVVDGSIAVNHGFWDTYRTVWPLYALAYPELAATLADGFVEQFRTAGWISRWPSPGYADLMTGTSSDVAFADLDAKGVPLPDRVATYRAGLRNATVFPPDPAVGRKDLAETAYRGAPSPHTPEPVSWAFEGAINDHALAAMAERLAADAPPARAARYRDEAAYLRHRSSAWVNLYDPATGFFQSRWPDGAFRRAPRDYDPREWGGDYTEANGWAFAFPAPHDVAGLATLLGGRDALRRRLDAFFATPEDGRRNGTYPATMHELIEASLLRTGQFSVSNQPVHHIPFLYAFTDAPWRTSEVVNDVLRRLFRGSEIGQGYPGDEDNGEMSAWYLFAATGLYPLQVGTPRYTVHAPLFESVTWHLPGGDLVVRTHRASPGDVHIQRVLVDGEEHRATWIDHARLARGATIDVDVAGEPSDWGVGADTDPPSLSPPGEPPRPWRDLTGGGHLTRYRPHRLSRRAAVLVDDEGSGRLHLEPGDSLVWNGPADEARPVLMYTLTSSGTVHRTAWRLEAAADDEDWVVVDRRHDERFEWPGQIRPFSVGAPGASGRYRLVVEAAPAGGLELAQLELLTR